VTLPIYLLPYFSNRAKLVSLIFRKGYGRLRLIVILGLLRWANNILDWGSINNWKTDTYAWNKEIVVVTGGSNGIGALVAEGLAKKGIRVVVLDYQPLSWKARKCDLKVIGNIS
jgi:all-trans-retinol dehydrogenase (NAD+)